MDSTAKKYVKLNKAKKGYYLSFLKKTMCDIVHGIHDHIIKLVHYHTLLKSMNVNLRDSFLIWRALESLYAQIDILKTPYNI